MDYVTKYYLFIHSLRPSLFQVLVSTEHVVSKWYGDSEKRLAEIWNACDAMGGAVIFFDEVDALGNSRDKVYIVVSYCFHIYIYTCSLNQRHLYHCLAPIISCVSLSNLTKPQEGFFQFSCRK